MVDKKQRAFEYRSRPDVKKRTSIRTRAWHEATPRHSFNRALKAALRRRPTDKPITLDELMEKWRSQKGLCVISKQVMTWANGTISSTSTSISIDRINSKEGYTRDNVQLLCHDVNASKGQRTNEEFLQFARLVVKNLSKKRLG